MTTGAPRTFAAMSAQSYRLLFYSAAIVIFGVMGQAVARGWLARELTGTNAGLGGVMLAFGAAMLLTAPFGGVVADRLPKRTVLLGSVLAMMLSSLWIGLAVLAELIEYWMLVGAGAIQAAAFAFYLPARIALISEIVKPHLLQNAVVLAQMSQEAMRVIAPALAGVLIGVSWFGVGGVFVSAAALNVVAAMFVLKLPRTVRRRTHRSSPLRELADAVTYMRENSAVGLIALVTVGVVMIGFPYLTFLPTLAEERYAVGAIGFGVMSGAAGLGALAAGLVDASLNRGQRPWRVIVAAGTAFGVSVMLLGVADSFGLALVALAGIGASGLVFQTSTQALMLRLSDTAYHGRLQSMVILGFSGFGLAALPLGLLADAVTLEATFVGMGVVILVMVGAFTVVRRRQVTLAVGP